MVRAVRAQRQAKLQAALEELMTLIVRTVNDKKDHIPPVVSSAVLTFSFDISIAGYITFCFGLLNVACTSCPGKGRRQLVVQMIECIVTLCATLQRRM